MKNRLEHMVSQFIKMRISKKSTHSDNNLFIRIFDRKNLNAHIFLHFDIFKSDKYKNSEKCLILAK